MRYLIVDGDTYDELEEAELLQLAENLERARELANEFNTRKYRSCDAVILDLESDLDVVE